jgi:uncharacterized protein YciI
MDEKAVYICKIQPVRPAMLTEGRTPDEDRVVSEHARYLDDLVEKGVVHLVGRTLTTGYSTYGIFIFSAESEQAAQRIVEQDPAMKQRVMRAELHPFRLGMVGKFPETD